MNIKFGLDNLDYLKNTLSKEQITFPQIFIKSENDFIHIGGWSDLYKYYKGTFDFDKLYQVAYFNLN